VATVSRTLSIAEFELQYGKEKPYYEYWHGEAIQKSMPTWIHGLLQRLLMELLSRAGYEAGSEVKLKIAPDFHPVPDIIATRGSIEDPYPTRAVEIVVEILSDEDPMSRVLEKCRAYQDWGFQEIYIVNPRTYQTFRWVELGLQEVTSIAGQSTKDLWTALEIAMKTRAH
jgi:Uma2 family endonuclease